MSSSARTRRSGLPGRAGSGITEQLNRALVLALAAEFQGFSRDLHDLAVDFFVAQTAGTNPTLAVVLRNRLTEARQLDRGNAQPGALGADFGRLGLALWPDLDHADKRSARRRIRLEALNDCRNAIAHAQQAKLDAVRDRGYPLTLSRSDGGGRLWTRWRRPWTW